MDDRARMELLGRAAADIEEALELMRRAVKGTEFEVLFEKTEEQMQDVLGPNDGHSIRDIIGSIAHSNADHPIWTRPLDSVKYANRRDI